MVLGCWKFGGDPEIWQPLPLCWVFFTSYECTYVILDNEGIIDRSGNGAGSPQVPPMPECRRWFKSLNRYFTVDNVELEHFVTCLSMMHA